MEYHPAQAQTWEPNEGGGGLEAGVFGREQELPGQTKSGTIDQLSRTPIEVLPDRSPNAQEHERKMVHPTGSLRPGHQALLDDSVHPLDHIPLAWGW